MSVYGWVALVDHGRSQGKRASLEVGFMYPPATGKQECVEADRSASVWFVRGRPSQPHRSHRARKLRIGSRDAPGSGRRAITLTTRIGERPSRGSPGIYTAAAKPPPR